MSQRTLFSIISAFSAFLVCGPVLTAQVTTAEEAREAAREFARESIREKIRFDTDRLDQFITVGELRALYGQSGLNGESADKANARLMAEDLLVSGDSFPESEVHAAINPTDSSNIVVSPIRQSSQQQGSLLCPIYYTKDFGKTWHKSQFLNLPPQDNALIFGGGDPVFAFNADGRLYFTWIDLYATSDNDSTLAGIFFATSDDGGETWEFSAEHTVVLDAVQAGAPLGIYQLPRFSDKQWMAVDMTNGTHRNTLYVAYVELSVTGQEAGKIVVRRLLPETGRFVNNSVPVSDGSFEVVQFSSVGVDEVGNVHVSFFGSRNGVWGLWHSFSTDGGQLFSDPVKISQVRFGGARFGGQDSETILGITAERLYPSPYMAVDHSGGETDGTLYTVWTGLGTTTNRGKGFDIYLSRLQGFNDPEIQPEWSEPIIVNDDGLEGDQFYPSITVSPEGVVIVTWYDKRGDLEGKQTHYYMAYSFDGGRTFTKNIQVSAAATDFSTIGQQNGNFGIGEYTQVLATSGYAIPVWGDGRSGNGNLDIYAAFMPISSESSAAPLYPDHVSRVEEGLSVGAVIPNPVGGEDAALTFSLERAAHVHVDLIDVTGAVVRTLTLQDSFEAGEHRITIPTKGLAHGTYFCRLATDKGVVARKVTVTE